MNAPAEDCLNLLALKPGGLTLHLGTTRLIVAWCYLVDFWPNIYRRNTKLLLGVWREVRPGIKALAPGAMRLIARLVAFHAGSFYQGGFHLLKSKEQLSEITFLHSLG